MPEIIDVMTLDVADCPTFVADNAVDFVTPTMAVDPVYKNTHGLNIFSKGDSFKVLSCGLNFPESFCRSIQPGIGLSSLTRFGLLIKGNPTGALYYNPSFSGAEFYLPMENYEFILDVYSNCEDTYKGVNKADNLLKENFVITSYFVSLYVSMLNIPAAINGKTFYVVPFIKILHNSVLS